MNTETKNTEVTTEEAVEETTTEENQETETTGSESTESTETSPEPLQVDYKAKAEELEKKLAGVKFKEREEKRELSEDEKEEISKGVSEERLIEILNERDSKYEKKLESQKLSSMAESLTESEDEANYAMQVWQNTDLSHISDSKEEQLRFVIAGMNHERVLAQNNELKRSLQSKDTANRNTATTARDARNANEPSVEGDMKAVLNKKGFKYSNEKKAYTKKLANGKTMFADGKGKTWVE